MSVLSYLTLMTTCKIGFNIFIFKMRKVSESLIIVANIY